MSYFNVRVYGFLINDEGEVLLSDEQEYGTRFIKFPGGGLELGEGLIDGLKREFMEECGTEINVGKHIHTTDSYIRSAFNDSQVIAVYYRVYLVTPLNCRISTVKYDFRENVAEPLQSFRWVPLSTLSEDEFTFEMDRQAFRQLLENI